MFTTTHLLTMAEEIVNKNSILFSFDSAFSNDQRPVYHPFTSTLITSYD